MADRFASPQTTVITGASGWLGRALVDRMLSDPSRPQLRLLAYTTAEARAIRAVSALSDVSTMRLAPLGSKWVRSDISCLGMVTAVASAG